jgi:hypothetical protein
MEPNFKGTFVGQVCYARSQVTDKLIPIEDKETGNTVFYKKEVIEKVKFVWNGKKWLRKS